MNPLIPQRKVIAGGVGGAISYLILRVLNEMYGITVQAEDAIALYTVIMFFLQYVTPNAKVPDETLPTPPAA